MKESWLGFAWNKLYISKKEGGLGCEIFRLLVKLLLLNKRGGSSSIPVLSWKKALKNKYFPYSSFMDVKLSPIASYTWKSIMSARSFLSKGVKKIVGRGNTINIWEDPWVSTLPNFRILTAENKEEERPRHVCELIVDGA